MLAISLAWIASSEHTRPRSIGVYPNNRRRELPPQSERIGPRRLRQRLTCFFSDAQRCGRQRIGRWRCRESAVIWASLEARQSTVFYPIAGSLFPERAGCIPASTRFQDVQIRTANRNAKPAISDNAIRIASRNGSSASLSGCFVMGQATGSALQRRTGEIATAQNGVAARRHGAKPAVATTRDLLLLEKHCYVFVQQRTPPFHGRPRATPADGNRRLLSPAEWAASRDVPRQPSAQPRCYPLGQFIMYAERRKRGASFRHTMPPHGQWRLL